MGDFLGKLYWVIIGVVLLAVAIIALMEVFG